MGRKAIKTAGTANRAKSASTGAVAADRAVSGRAFVAAEKLFGGSHAVAAPMVVESVSAAAQVRIKQLDAAVAAGELSEAQAEARRRSYQFIGERDAAGEPALDLLY